jgi:hypothetical protein
MGSIASTNPTISDDNAPKDECYRCGYDLRGVGDDQPCPECGLLAGRSRRTTDQLHDTRPQWLRRLAIGIWLILLSLLVLLAWLFTFEPVDAPSVTGRSVLLSVIAPWLGLDAAAVVFFIGVVALTLPERYPPADEKDARLRRWMRWAAVVPILALLLMHCQAWLDFHARAWPAWRYSGSPPERDSQIAGTVGFYLAIFGCLPLPLLLFYRLRGIARRARSAHLAEHCMIVGIGTSASLLYVVATWIVMAHASEWFGDRWTDRSTGWLVMMTILGTAVGLFFFWSLYLLIRFAITIGLASRALRRKWRMEDRSLAQP